MFVTFPNWDQFVAEPMRKAGGNAQYVILAFIALMLSQLLHTVRGPPDRLALGFGELYSVPLVRMCVVMYSLPCGDALVTLW
jgi:hypothetical protein